MKALKLPKIKSVADLKKRAKLYQKLRAEGSITQEQYKARVKKLREVYDSAKIKAYAKDKASTS